MRTCNGSARDIHVQCTRSVWTQNSTGGVTHSHHVCVWSSSMTFAAALSAALAGTSTRQEPLASVHTQQQHSQHPCTHIFLCPPHISWRLAHIRNPSSINRLPTHTLSPAPTAHPARVCQSLAQPSGGLILMTPQQPSLVGNTPASCAEQPRHCPAPCCCGLFFLHSSLCAGQCSLWHSLEQ